MSDKLELLAKLKAMKLTQFSFTNFEKKVSSPDEKGERMAYLMFELETPVSEVISSNAEFVPVLNKRVANRAVDVKIISCSYALIEKYIEEFTFDEDKDKKLTKSGKYEGDMFFDLSKAEDVWLTDTKFSKMRVDFINKGKSEKLMTLLGKSPTLLAEYKAKMEQAS